MKAKKSSKKQGLKLSRTTILITAVLIATLSGILGWRVYKSNSDKKAHAGYTLVFSPNGASGTFAVYACYVPLPSGARTYRYYVRNGLGSDPRRMRIINSNPAGYYYVSKSASYSQVISTNNFSFNMQNSVFGNDNSFAGGYTMSLPYASKAQAC